MKHLKEEDLVLDFYGESSEEVRRHLAGCEECRNASRGLSEFLREIPDEHPPEPGAGWEDQVWSRLQWRLRERPKRSWRPALAAAALIALAFIAGMLSRDLLEPSPAVAPADDPIGMVSNEEGRNRVFLLVVSEHLDRSERVLLELTREPDSAGADRQSRARQLLSTNRLYRLTAEQAGDTRMAALLEELEPVLTELARSDGESDGTTSDAIRQRVEDQELIFKIRVVGQQVRQESTPAPAPNQSI